MPERASRTHVVPGNIMSVEFKLFDIMTLKQFLYLVVAAFISYVLFSILPDSMFKWLIPAVLMIAGVIIAFVQFNGEPFEVYTTNFILGVIQPQRRVWSKTPVIKKAPAVAASSNEANAQRAIHALSDKIIPQEEIIPVNFNIAPTAFDDAEKQFLRADQKRENFLPNTAALPPADLSKLNFSFALNDTGDIEKETQNTQPLIDLKPVQSVNTSAMIEKEKAATNNRDIIIDLSSPVETISTTNITKQLEPNLTVNSSSMNPNSINSNVKNAFTIDMDDDTSPSPFVPLAQDVSQAQRAQSLPDITMDVSQKSPIIATNTNLSTDPSATAEHSLDELQKQMMQLDTASSVPQIIDSPISTPVNTQVLTQPITQNEAITGSLLQELNQVADPIPAPISTPVAPLPITDNLVINSGFSNTPAQSVQQLPPPLPVQNNLEPLNTMPVMPTAQSQPFQPNNSFAQAPMQLGDPLPKATPFPVPPQPVVETQPLPQPLDTHTLETVSLLPAASSLPTPISMSANDPNAGKIHGKVISADLKSMPGLAIIMFDSDGKALESVVTNDLGEFVFNQLPKTFEVKIFSPKKFLFSPMDKVTKEIIIHELSNEPRNATFPTIFKQESTPSASADVLTTIPEMDTMDTRVPNTINGVVKDDKGHYLAGVLVSIRDSLGNTIRALATNPLGQFFSHSPLPHGQYTILFEKEGVDFQAFTVQLDGKIYPPKMFVGKVKSFQNA